MAGRETGRGGDRGMSRAPPRCHRGPGKRTWPGEQMETPKKYGVSSVLRQTTARVDYGLYRATSHYSWFG